MISFKNVLVVVSLCALIGCEQKDGRDDGAISGMISGLSIRPAADFSGVYGSVTQICARIEKSVNVTGKAGNYKALATRLANIDFAGLGDNDRTLVFGDYWRSLALVCSKMAAENSLDKESFALILKGWKKCQEMCNLSDEQDVGLRQESERKLRAMFENDATLFERDILRLMFKSRNVSTEKQAEFYDMWHATIGCKVKSHPECQRGEVRTMGKAHAQR